ncbi:MAG: helix-turn-helix transcriptional regulator [Chloroflexota bacterium]
MANRRRAIQESRDRWSRVWPGLVDELREARLMAGLTQAAIAAALGVSRDRVARVELRRVRNVGVEYLVSHAAAVGLKASIKFYPTGGAIRDEAQASYIARFVERIGHAWRIKLDVPILLPGDLRAVDVLLQNSTCRIVVEVITRLRDLQAQLRAAQLKQRDLGADRMILVIAGSHANRLALTAARPTLLATFELDTRRVLASLAAGQDPGRDAVIALR